MPTNVATWMDRNAIIYPQKVAVKDERWSLRYGEWNKRIKALAADLHQRGVQKGDRVAVLLPNCMELVEIMFASARLGAIFVPLNWRLGEDELAFILNDCTPSLLFFEEGWKGRAENLKDRMTHELGLVAIDEDLQTSSYEATLAEKGEVIGDLAQVGDVRASGGDDDLMIIYTSGTTGNPKGVVLTHANVFWQCINGWSLGVSPDSVCLVLLPLFHVGGLNGSVTPMLHIGATVILQRQFNPAVVLKTIEEEQVTGVLGVPTIYRILSEQPEFTTTDLSACDVLLSGGAPLPESLIQLYHERGLEFRQGYGLTEASPGVTGMGPGECHDKAGSAGRQILYTEVRVVDEQDQEVPVGESGEIIVRGPNVMRGYWNRPEETAKALKGGWLRTGDVGKFDEDGFLYIVDRKKDMIISGGENIYPAEIEKLLAGHPDVQQVTVVARPDDKWSEVPVAVVVPHTSDLDEEALKSFITPKLARYKLPKSYYFVEDLPLNASGKVVKADVRKRLGFVS